MPIDSEVPQATSETKTNPEIAVALRTIEELSAQIKQMRSLFDLVIGTLEQVACGLVAPPKVISVAVVDSQRFQWFCVECLQRVTVPEMMVHECMCGSGDINPLAGPIFDAINATQRKIKHVFSPCNGNPEKPCYTEF